MHAHWFTDMFCADHAHTCNIDTHVFNTDTRWHPKLPLIDAYAQHWNTYTLSRVHTYTHSALLHTHAEHTDTGTHSLLMQTHASTLPFRDTYTFTDTPTEPPLTHTYTHAIADTHILRTLTHSNARARLPYTLAADTHVRTTPVPTHAALMGTHTYTCRHTCWYTLARAADTRPTLIHRHPVADP